MLADLFNTLSKPIS